MNVTERFLNYVVYDTCFPCAYGYCGVLSGAADNAAGDHKLQW